MNKSLPHNDIVSTRREYRAEQHGALCKSLCINTAPTRSADPLKGIKKRRVERRSFIPTGFNGPHESDPEPVGAILSRVVADLERRMRERYERATK